MKNYITILSLLTMIITMGQTTITVEMFNGGRPDTNMGPVYITGDWPMTQTWNSTGIDPLTVRAEFHEQNEEYYHSTPNTFDAGINTLQSLMFGIRSTNFDENADNANNDYKEPYLQNVHNYIALVGTPVTSYFSVSPLNIGEGMNFSQFNQGNGAFLQYTSVEGIAASGSNCNPDNTVFEMGKVTYTFNRPVTNPVMHISGLGGWSGTFIDNTEGNQFFTTELTLSAASSAYTLERLSGTPVFVVDSDLGKIGSSFGDVQEPIDDDNGTDNLEAGTGSVVIRGTNITSVTFDVTLRTKRDNCFTMPDMYAGDAYTVSFSNITECTILPTGDSTPAYVGITTLERNTDQWLSPDNQENMLSAYLALESATKPFVITRISDPETAIGTTADQGAVEGMVVWDTDDQCLKVYKVDTAGNGLWTCVNRGCNQ